MATVARQTGNSIEGSAFAEQSVHAFRLIIEELKRRSYHVILLMPPFRQESLELIASQPASMDRERRMRELVCDPARSGADAFVEIRDAQARSHADDDAIFIDYGHLNRAGAELQSPQARRGDPRTGDARSTVPDQGRTTLRVFRSAKRPPPVRPLVAPETDESLFVPAAR